MTRGSSVRAPRATAAAVVCVLSSAAAIHAAGPSWRLDHGDVQVTVPLKPGGAFTATTSALSGTLTLDTATPVRLGGEVRVDLGTIDTGIGLRNQHLREKYLEVARGEGYDKAVMTALSLSDAPGEGFLGTTPFTGTLLLHGVKREVSGKAEIKAQGSLRRVQAEFPLVLTDFGVTPPEYLGVGVGSRLLVKVTVTATPLPEGAAAPR